MEISLLARAKINLGLKVVRRRSDGYHDIDTILQPLVLADRIKLTLDQASEGQIRVWCNHQEVPRDEANLAYQAAAVFLDQTQIAPSLDIQITKMIPVAAGLGGGSADAAAVLHGLDMVCPGLPLSDLAGNLGSDVPFFLGDGVLRAQGRGTRLRPVGIHSNLDRLQVILLKPPFSVSASQGYQAWQEDGGSTADIDAIEDLLETGDAKGLMSVLANDLESGVLAGHSYLARLAHTLKEHDLSFLMSGSGPTLVVFPKEARASQRAISHLRRTFPGLTVLYTQTYLEAPLEVVADG